MRAARLHELLVAAVLVTLPLSTGAHEVSMALLLGWALLVRRAAGFSALPWSGAAVATAAACVLGAWASGDVREGFGQAWLLAPLVALAGPVEEGSMRWLLRLGVGAAAVAAAMAVTQAAVGGEGRGLFSHHLSLAYALLPPFAVALSRRQFPLAALLAAGVLAARSDAAPIALLATALAVWTGRPLVATLLGSVATLGALAGFAGTDELRQRAVLWTGGLLVGPGSAGAGGYALASAPEYERLSPGFWFPNHAHDSFIQLGATLGAGGVLAMAVLVLAAMKHGHPAARAGLAGVLVGGLTQNTLGDLEVARAVWVWLAILGTVGHAGGQSAACPPPSSSSAPPLLEPSTRP